MRNPPSGAERATEAAPHVRHAAPALVHHPLSTPLVVGNIVYAASDAGVLHALDVTPPQQALPGAAPHRPLPRSA